MVSVVGRALSRKVVRRRLSSIGPFAESHTVESCTTTICSSPFTTSLSPFACSHCSAACLTKASCCACMASLR
jgi:hypothetical protein